MKILGIYYLELDRTVYSPLEPYRTDRLLLIFEIVLFSTFVKIIINERKFLEVKSQMFARKFRFAHLLYLLFLYIS